MDMTVSADNLGDFSNKFWNYVDGAKVFAFHGDMGAGKTTLIAALCRGKGVTDAIGSPTFSIINQYNYVEGGEAQALYHIDLYRLKDEEEIIRAGVEDCVYSGAVCMVEWPDKAPQLFDENAVHVYVQPVDTTTRLIKTILPQSMSNNSRNL